MAGPRYIADAAAGAAQATMEGFVVLYHAPSRATHLLASPAPEILAAIAPVRGAADLRGIVDRLRADYDLDGDADAVVAERLAELMAAGLVRVA